MNIVRFPFQPVRLFVLLLALVGLPANGVAVVKATGAEGRVIVLGFDGASARTTQALIDQGQLPNLKRLADQGTFAPLLPTNPAESAAGWAALNTGLNPARNGVASFIVRDLSTGAPGPNTGHIGTEDRAIEDFEHTGLMKILVRYGGLPLTLGTALIVLIGFFVVFAGLLRVKKSLALPLALVLAGVGAWGAVKASTYVPRKVAGVYTNRVAAEGFWAPAARHGVRSVVLDAALAFDQPTVDGARVLSGLGLPDARGGSSGEWFIYTTDDLELDRPPKGAKTGSGAGTIFRVDEREGAIASELYGPVNFWEVDRLQQELEGIEERLADPDLGWKESNTLRDRKTEIQNTVMEKQSFDRVTLPLAVEKTEGKARVTLGSRTQELSEGEWSDWYHLSFQINPLIKAHAVTRAKIVSMDEPFELLVNNFEIDPGAPPFWQPISQPESFSAELEGWIEEPFETVGWSCMTNGIKDKKLDIDTFLEDIEFTMGWRKKLTYAAFERDDWSILFSVFSTTDRVQHVMYKYYDPGHPYYDEAEASRTITFFGEETALKDVIPAIYKQMDAIVGEVVDRHLEPTDTLLLCADHGFTSYRRGMHVNNWLAKNGYLTLRDGVSRGDGAYLSAYPDWDRTKAYSLGLGMVFLNLEGREPNGIVSRAEAQGVLEAIAADFVAAVDTGEVGSDKVDPALVGKKVGRDAVIMKDFYEGPWGTTEYECADLMLGFEENYRASWTTVLGKIKLVRDGEGAKLGVTFQNNSNNWSGDHASVSPEVVQGIFFSSRKVDLPAEGVSVMHMAPTVLATMGVPLPAGLDKEPLKFLD